MSHDHPLISRNLLEIDDKIEVSHRQSCINPYYSTAVCIIMISDPAYQKTVRDGLN